MLGGCVTDGVIVLDFEVSDLAIVSYFDLPQSILGVPAPSEDDFPVEGDFTACAVKVNFASHIT